MNKKNKRKIIDCKENEVIVSNDDIEYSFRLAERPGFEIEIKNQKAKDRINTLLERFIKLDTRAANRGKIFTNNLEEGFISISCFKWLNSHCYTNKVASWVTKGKLMCNLEELLFGFNLNTKLKGQCNYEHINMDNKSISNLVITRIHEDFGPCPICNK